MTVHRVSRFGFVNAFLVEEPDGFTLIDTMLPGSAKAILKVADGREIKRIALTHAHGDHIGSLDALAERLPGVEVLNSAATRRKVTMYVGITGIESDAAAKGSIAAAVGSATEILIPTPKIVVRIGTSGAA